MFEMIKNAFRTVFLYIFCQHEHVKSIKYYIQDFASIYVYRVDTCKKCGKTFITKLATYYSVCELDKIRQMLEAKGIKNLEDL